MLAPDFRDAANLCKAADARLAEKDAAAAQLVEALALHASTLLAATPTSFQK